MDNPNDRVKLSIHTSTNGSWIFIVSRAYALGLIEAWQEPDVSGTAPFLKVEGTLYDLDANRATLVVRRIVVTAIYLQEANRM